MEKHSKIKSMKSMITPSIFIYRISAWFNGLFLAQYASLIRILVYGYLFYGFRDSSNIGYSQLDFEFWNPTGMARGMNFIAPPFAYFSIIEIIWKFSLLTCILGFLSRWSKFIAFVGYSIVGAYDQHFGYVTFSGIPLFSMLLFLIFLEDECYSVDRLLRKKEEAKKWVEVWPVICFQICLVSLYMGSAAQKLRLHESLWLNGSSIRYFFTNYFNEPALSFILIFCATSTVLLELTSPLIFTRKLRLIYTVSFILLHIFSHYFLYISSSSAWIVGILTFYFSGKAVIRTENSPKL